MSKIGRYEREERTTEYPAAGGIEQENTGRTQTKWELATSTVRCVGDLSVRYHLRVRNLGRDKGLCKGKTAVIMENPKV